MNNLSFVKLTRKDCGSGVRQFHDFVVSGNSLFDTVGAEYDFIALFGDLYYPKHQVALRKQLLLEQPSELEGPWVPLYVCPECGDSGCGLVSTKVSKTEKGFVWSDFRYEDENHPDAVNWEWYEYLPNVGPFVFNPKQYRDALMSLTFQNR